MIKWFLANGVVTMANSIPLVLKQHDWPQADKTAWDALFAVSDYFDESTPCAYWSDGSRNKRAQSYGQWLSFLKRTSPKCLTSPPAFRVTQIAVKVYIEECEARLKPRSVASLASDLYVVIRAMSPDTNWDWLNSVSKRLQANAQRRSLPAPHPISATEVLHYALEWIKRHDGNNRYCHKTQAIRFRQGLMIAFLVSRPVRRRTLLATSLDDHLQLKTDGYHLYYNSEDMKNGKSYDFPLPDVLTLLMHRYLEVHRPALLQGKQSSALWIGQYGDPITPDGLSREFPKATKRILGVALRPHAFRHIAATFIAESDPEQANIIRDVLGHSTLDMAQKHYNRATGKSACDDYQNLIARLRKEGAKRL